MGLQLKKYDMNMRKTYKHDIQFENTENQESKWDFNSKSLEQG